MPNFGRIADLHTVSYITGPKHIWLGISFSKSLILQPKMIEREAIGACRHGQLDAVQISSAVADGVKDAGIELHVARIEFVANDTPDYVMYRHCAKLLAQRAYQRSRHNFVFVQ